MPMKIRRAYKVSYKINNRDEFQLFMAAEFHLVKTVLNNLANPVTLEMVNIDLNDSNWFIHPITIIE